MARPGKKKGSPKTPGSGRRKGSLNQATVLAHNRRAAIVAKAVASGATPLDVMLENMSFARDEAARLATELAKKPNDAEKIEATRKDLLAMRRVAQECARDAAPFMHPRLTSVDMKGNLGITLTTQEQAVAEMERAAAAVRQRRSSSSGERHAEQR